MSASAPDDPEAFVAAARRLAAAALARWDLAPVRIEPVKVRENAVFRVELADGRLVALRVHRHGYHSNAALDAEFAWMRALAAAGVAVPRVLPSRRGRDYECLATPELPEVRQVDVFEWISGRPLGSVEACLAGEAKDVAAQFRAIGALMARMHAQACAWGLPAGFARHSWDREGLVGEQPLWGRFWDLAALSAGQRRQMLEVRDALRRGLDAFGRSRECYGLIHADLVPENILLDGDSLRVIDFDDAGFGWHLFDIATSLYFLTGVGEYEAARRALLEGYRSVRMLPGEHEAALPLFLAARSTTYLGWVHTRQHTQTARELTPFLIERACAVTGTYLEARAPR